MSGQQLHEHHVQALQHAPSGDHEKAAMPAPAVHGPATHAGHHAEEATRQHTQALG